MLAMSMPVEFNRPAWLFLCLLVPLIALISGRALTGLEPVRRWAAIAARCAVVVLVALCLADIQLVRRNDNLTVMFVMDRSHSVAALQDYQEEFVRTATAKVKPRDRVGLVDFARNAYLQQLPMEGGYFIPPGRLPVMPNTDRTDVASGLRLAMAMFPADTAKRIVLLSDGNDNMGDVLTESRRAKSDGIPIDIVPLRYQHRNEIYFDRMIAPTHAEQGEQLPLRMVLNTKQRASGTIAVFQNGKPVELPPEASKVALQPGDNTFFLKLPAQGDGAQTFEATFRPDDPSMDAVPLNNSGSAFTFVSGDSRVLLVSADDVSDQALVDALRGENVDVELVTAPALERWDLLKMTGYSAIMLSNIPAAAFTDEQLAQLATYVREGGGLIMLGGDEGFGAGGWIGTPIEEVMPVSFEIKHKRVLPRGALVLIMHSCEVARGNFWATEMAKKSLDTVSSQDYLGVLAYTWSPGGTNWEVPLDLATNKAAIRAKIDRIQVGDMPDFGASMQMAFTELTTGRGRDAAQKHVIIFSDGDAGPPSPQLINDYAKAKITVSTVGIGWGAHVMEPTMRSIAEQTGGRFYAPRNPRQLPQIFAKESKVVRRPLIVDEDFQPRIAAAHSELLGGIDAGELPPPLGGLVLTSVKQNPNVLMPLIRTTNDGDDPVLAHWQFELGKTVAFTSGWWPHWGENWTQWSRFGKFWAQIVRWSMRQEVPANFETYTRVDGSRARIVVDALDKDASYLNFLQLKSNAIGPDNQPIPLHFVQTGPGKYEAEFDAERAGQYLANVHVFDRGKQLGTLRTGLSAPFSPEYKDLVSNEALLRQLAEISSGRWLDVPGEQADVFSHDLPPTKARQTAWNWVLAWLLLPAFLIDVAVRRLANWLAMSIAVEIVLLAVLLFGMGLAERGAMAIVGSLLLAELVGWSIRFRYIRPLVEFVTQGVGVLTHAGDRSAQSLGKLRGIRERVRDKIEGEPAGAPGPTVPVAPLPKGTSRRRFDAGDAAQSPSTDLGDALGGARSVEPPASTPGTDKPAGEKGGESTTSRLLRAKRRGRNDDIGNV